MPTTHQTEELDRVRANTLPDVLKKIDSGIAEKIRFYATQPSSVISERIMELDKEWDIERWLEANASSIALSTLFLGLTVNRKWLLVTTGVLGFLFMHAVKGWCPPVPALRRLGIRTRGEIDREKYALKMLRGDFKSISTDPTEMKRNPMDQVVDAVAS